MTEKLFAHLDNLIQHHWNEQVAFLQQLVRTRSANPYLPTTSDPHEPIEQEVAYLIYNKLTAIGLAPELQGETDARPNVLAAIAGARDHRTLILNGHMDTVMPTPQWTRDPYGAEIDGGRLYGLGALDMKASLSMFVFVAQMLIEAGVELDGHLRLTFAVDEEPGASSRFGTAYLLNRGLTGTAAIIAEPMNTNVTIGHRGGYRFRLAVKGEAAHTGLEAWERGERGKNAITAMSEVIQALQDIAIPYVETPAFPGRKPVLTFPTLIEGGHSINTVPDSCVAYGDVRLLPGANAETVEMLIREQLDAIPSLDYTLERIIFVPAVEISPDSEIVRPLVEHTTAITGRQPTTQGCGPWNDGWMFITRGIPAICGFGPNGAGAHAPDEYVELSSLHDTTRILARVVVDYLGVKS